MLKAKLIIKAFISVIVIIMVLSSCRKVFDYSIYSAYVPVEYRDIKGDNLQKLENQIPDSISKNKLCFALISDSHSYFDDLEDAVVAINQDSDVELLIIGGDVTDGGILDEYMIFRHIMDQSIHPYFTVIGNHDCLANGFSIYNEIYGEDDYVLTVANCKFVFFNDIVWELNNREPDYFWLNDQLANSEEIQHTFVIAHIPPYSDSFTPLQEYAYTSLLDSNNVRMSINGHNHDYYFGQKYDDGVDYLVIGSVDNRHYIKVTVDYELVTMERVRF